MESASFALLLDVFRALLLILVISTLVGRLAILVGQPRVVGEMLAGVVLGPSLFGAVFPAVQQAVFPAGVKAVLYVLSTIGLTLYMFLVGAGHEKHPASARDLLHPVLLAVTSVLAPLALGTITVLLFLGQLSVPGVSPGIFALFVGGALSVTAFPMLARIIYERDIVHTRFGALAMLAASIDDAAAWCILAVTTALAAGGALWAAAQKIVLAALFALTALIILPRLLKRQAERASMTGTISHELFALILTIIVLFGWFTDYIGIYSVFGGFLAGMAMPRIPQFQQLLHTRMMQITSVLLLPIFFTLSGLNTKLATVVSWRFIGAFLVLLFTALVGKYFFSFFAMCLLGYNWRESSAMGGLMNARGLMIIIFINIGLAAGLLTTEMFSMLVLISLITSLLAMPIYKGTVTKHDEAVMRAEQWRTEAAESPSRSGDGSNVRAITSA